MAVTGCGMVGRKLSTSASPQESERSGMYVLNILGAARGTGFYLA